MITFVIFDIENRDGVKATEESLYNSCVGTGKQYSVMYVNTIKNAIELLPLVSTSYAVILKSGDTLELYPMNEYHDLIGIPGSSETGTIRGIRIGSDVLDFISTYVSSDNWNDSSEQNIKRLLMSRFDLIESDIFKMNIHT